MPFFPLVLFLWLGNAGFAAATEGAALVARARECACSEGSPDSLENPGKFGFGAFRGACIDSCRYRRSEILGAVAAGSPGEHLLVSNLKHEGGYWKARIPLSGAPRAYVGFEEFLPGISHVFLLFRFPERPLSLRSQSSRELTRIRELVISPEGVPARDKKYNLFDASMGRYLLAVRLLSRSEMRAWSVGKLHHKVSLYPLDLSPGQARAILRQALLFAEQSSFRVKYDLLSGNCATHTLDWIDRALGVPAAGLFPLGRALPVRGPVGTFHVLVERGLVTEEEGAPL